MWRGFSGGVLLRLVDSGEGLEVDLQMTWDADGDRYRPDAASWCSFVDAHNPVTASGD